MDYFIAFLVVNILYAYWVYLKDRSNPIVYLNLSFMLFYAVPYFFYGDGIFLARSDDASLVFLSGCQLLLNIGDLTSRLVYINLPRMQRRSIASVFKNYSPFVATLLFCVIILSFIEQLSQLTVYLSLLLLVYAVRKDIKINPIFIYVIIIYVIVILGVYVLAGDKSDAVTFLFLLAMLMAKFYSGLRIVVLASIIMIGIFYFSAISRVHPLVDKGLVGAELIFRLFVGRLNMITPYLKVYENPQLYNEILSLFPMQNSIFPNIIYGVFPSFIFGRDDISPAKKFGELYYGVSDVNVSSSIAGEMFGNFGWYGLVVFFLFGAIHFFYVKLFLKVFYGHSIRSNILMAYNIIFCLKFCENYFVTNVMYAFKFLVLAWIIQIILLRWQFRIGTYRV